MNLQELLDKAQTHYSQELPFVIYRKPHQKTVNGYFQKQAKTNFSDLYQTSGFILAPFNGNGAVVIRKNESDVHSVSYAGSASNTGPIVLDEPKDNSLMEAHVKLVSKSIDFIRSGKVDKVVLSRKELIKIDGFSLAKTFQSLLDQYTNALCYAWFHPKTGLWVGATPETLLSIKNRRLSTMALAGTQKYEGHTNVSWSQKELKEQQYVTDYIARVISDQVTAVEISDPYTVKAGNLLHLRSDLMGLVNTTSSMPSLLQMLHPTPAVCGVPKNEALQFILQNEGYNREFYTGFLGELDGLGNCDLFVNLRCMKLDNNMAHIYVGGGITGESNPVEEWQETLEKSKVIKKALAIG